MKNKSFVTIGFVFLVIGVHYLFGELEKPLAQGGIGLKTFWYTKAVKKGVSGVKGAITKKNINQRGAEGYTALMMAAAAGDTDKDFEIVMVLVENGANVNLRGGKSDMVGGDTDKIGNAPLHRACQNGNVRVAEYLLEKNANPLLFNDNKEASVHTLSRCQDMKHFSKILEMLVTWGININFVDKKKGMPLIFWTLSFGPPNIEAFKIIQKKYPHLIDFEMKVGGKTLKEFAKTQLEDDFKESLVQPKFLKEPWEARMEPNNFDKRFSFNEDFTITQVAAIKGKEKFLQTLIENGADINLPDRKYGNTPLHWALMYNRPKIVEVLGKNEVDANLPNNQDNTTTIPMENRKYRYPIHYLYGIAKKSDRKKVAKILFENGADLNAQDKDGNTFLHRAVLLADEDMVKLITSDRFFKERVDFTIENKNQKTPLAIAKKNNNKKIIEMLTKDKELSNPPIEFAVMRGDFTRVKNLIASKPKDIDKKYRSDTLLQLALKFRKPKIALFLLEKGAKVNKKNRMKNMALHEVVNIRDSQMRNELARKIIEKGGDVALPNKEGDTVIHLAVKKSQPELILFLKENFGKIAKNKKGKTALDLAKELPGRDQQTIIDVLQKKK